jgi:hypothetical protein
MRSFTIALTAGAIAAALSMASFADAAPGDYRVVTGTVVWPAQVVSERTIMIQGDDGGTYFAELASAETFSQLGAGDRVSLIAREGFQANQLLFAQTQPGPDVGRGVAPSALPGLAASATIVPDIRESPDVVVGVVVAVQVRGVSVITHRGNRVEVDVSKLDPDIRRDLRPGDPVTLYTPLRVNGQPVASGILVEHTAASSALPRQ